MKKLPIWYDLEKHLMTEMGDALEGEFGSLDEVMAFLEKYPALYDFRGFMVDVRPLGVDSSVQLP